MIQTFTYLCSRLCKGDTVEPISKYLNVRTLSAEICKQLLNGRNITQLRFHRLSDRLSISVSLVTFCVFLIKTQILQRIASLRTKIVGSCTFLTLLFCI